MSAWNIILDFCTHFGFTALCNEIYIFFHYPESIYFSSHNNTFSCFENCFESELAHKKLIAKNYLHSKILDYLACASLEDAKILLLLNKAMKKPRKVNISTCKKKMLLAYWKVFSRDEKFLLTTVHQFFKRFFHWHLLQLDFVVPLCWWFSPSTYIKV